MATRWDMLIARPDPDSPCPHTLISPFHRQTIYRKVTLMEGFLMTRLLVLILAMAVMASCATSRYVGEYKDGKYHGQGTLTSKDGGTYVGAFTDDKRNGQGTQTYTDGGRYVGKWMDGKRDGQGTLTFADGRPTQEGLWASDVLFRSENINPPPAPSQYAEVALNNDRKRLAEERRSRKIDNN